MNGDVHTTLEEHGFSAQGHLLYFKDPNSWYILLISWYPMLNADTSWITPEKKYNRFSLSLGTRFFVPTEVVKNSLSFLLYFHHITLFNISNKQPNDICVVFILLPYTGWLFDFLTNSALFFS